MPISSMLSFVRDNAASVQDIFVRKCELVHTSEMKGLKRFTPRQLMDESLTRRFASKAPPLLEMFRPVIRYRRLASGEYLFEQGDEAVSLYGVLSGRLYITVGVPRTLKEAVVAVLLPGQLAGELSVIDGGVRSANARAEGDVLIGVISREDFGRHIIDHPEIGLRVLTMLSRRLRATTQQVESLALWDIPARLAKTLLDLADQDSQPLENDENSYVLGLPMSQKNLAAMIGSTREWVNAILHDWQALGTISYQGRCIVLRDLPMLHQIVANVEADV